MEYEQPFYSFNLSTKGYSKVVSRVNKLFPRANNRLKANISLYVINLICSPNGKIAVMRKKEWFKEHVIVGGFHSYRYGMGAQLLLESSGFVRYVKGRNARIGYKTGFASRLVATDKFMSLFPTTLYSRPSLDVHFCLDCICKEEIPSEEVGFYSKSVLLCETKGKKKLFSRPEYYKAIRNDSTSFQYNITTLDNKTQSRELKKTGKFLDNFKFDTLVKGIIGSYVLNKDYFSKIHLDLSENVEPSMVKNVYLTRIYKRGGGGRFFQINALSYQNIKREYRNLLLINKKPVVEVDYSSLHLNLLYNSKKLPCVSGDAYMNIVNDLIGKSNKDLREAIKKCVLISINAKDMNDYKSAMRWREKGDYEILQRFKISTEKVITSIIKLYPEISEFINSDASIDLMHKDSDLIENVLYRLKGKKILGVPLHDSIICQKGKEKQVKKIMEEEYKKFTSFDIKVEYK